MRIDPNTKEVTLTEIEYHELINPKPEVDEPEYGPYARQYPKSKVSQEQPESGSSEKPNDRQPEVDLEKEIELSIRLMPGVHSLEDNEPWYKGRSENIRELARHFYELGKNARKQEKEMIFYHGTTEENWGKIQQEGYLFGDRGTPSRCTYLTSNKEEAQKYGPVLLQVVYDPHIHPSENNYVDGCWQVRVYEPIPLSQIKELNARKEG